MIEDDWSPPITYFQVAVSYNLGKDNMPIGDAITKVWQPLIGYYLNPIGIIKPIWIDNLRLMKK
jgi:hypothetical protein